MDINTKHGEFKMTKATHYFHKITIDGRASKFSAWFNGDPMSRYPSLVCLIDCERIDAIGRSFPCTDKEKQILQNGAWSAKQWGTFDFAGES